MLTIVLEKTKVITIITAIFLIAAQNDLTLIESQKSEKIYPGRHEVVVNNVHDGDTITVEIPEFPSIIGENIGIRLDGIDTPEITDKRQEIKSIALEAKEYVQRKVSAAKKIEIDNLKRDKYFRIVAKVYIDGSLIQDELLKLKLAKPYDGGTKMPW
jgi:endonuclease YncB( thermonuclease family)